MGAIGLDENMKLLVSKGVNGKQMVEKLFWNFAGKLIYLHKDTMEYPKDIFINWHREQDFKQ
ncbi:restriction endonuclease, partial [Providencia stuartii]|nr:restriction endonuclease [Providencia stuartii]